MKLALLIFSSCAFIVGVEILKRRFLFPTSVTRRIIHIGTASIAGIAPLFVTKEEIIFVSIIFTLTLFFGRSSTIFSAIHTTERFTFGEIYLPLGVAIAALLFLPNHLTAFQFGIFVMGISDPIAGLVGEKFGKHHFVICKNRKSLEGSLAFFISTLILTLFFTTTLSPSFILISAILTVVEFLLVFGLDNLILPIVAASLFSLCGLGTNIFVF